MGDPCFDWKRPCFGGFNHQNRGQAGSRYISLYVDIYVYIYIHIIYTSIYTSFTHPTNPNPTPSNPLFRRHRWLQPSVSTCLAHRDVGTSSHVEAFALNEVNSGFQLPPKEICQPVFFQPIFFGGRRYGEDGFSTHFFGGEDQVLPIFLWGKINVQPIETYTRIFW